jgi:S-formylglutathione hydrolase FrmB
MVARLPTRRLLVGLTVIGLVAGCTSSATPPQVVASAAPVETAAPSVAVAVPTPAATPTPTSPATTTPTIGDPADDGARIIAVDDVGSTMLGAVDRTLDARGRDLTIDSPAVGTVKVRLLLPKGFDAKPATRWPVLYLLHGSYGAYDDWWRNTDVSALTAPTNLLVVMPDGGEHGWYSDWWNGGAGGPPEWETFHLVELRQLLERNWHAGDKRVIAGFSTGGYGAIEYAERRPGMFLAAASYSGDLDLLSKAFLGNDDVANGLWGDPVAQADVWKAHDPTSNAAALKGTALYVAYGNGQPGLLDPGELISDPWEALAATMNEAFVHRLAALRIPVTVDAYGPGMHRWTYFERDLHRSLPFLLKALGE